VIYGTSVFVTYLPQCPLISSNCGLQNESHKDVKRMDLQYTEKLRELITILEMPEMPKI
jgi:hypothetical protein